jgi:betaine lipid synthase
MASLIPNILLKDLHAQILIAGVALTLLVGIVFALTFTLSRKRDGQEPSAWESFVRFFYACFLKRQEKNSGSGQQAVLESFYQAQADVYDATRRTLLRGREDMLGLVAAQLMQKVAKDRDHDEKRIWVDVCFITISLSN